MSVAKVSVVVVNFNGRHLLAACLNSLRAQTYPDFEVILVDNGSSDGSLDYVQRAFPQVRIIANATNVGFAAGCNQAVAADQSEFIVMLNNDTMVEPTWLEELVRAVQADDRLGMAASKMLFADRPNMINSAGICIDRACIAWDRFGGLDDSWPDSNRATEIFGPCAGAALYRRSMLEDVGLFDEQFFMYLEDVDLAWRSQSRGWRCIYVPSARLYHKHSGTAVEGSAQKQFLLSRNKVWLVAKNLHSGGPSVSLVLVLFYDFMSVAYSTISRRDFVALRAKVAAMKGMAALLRRPRRARSGEEPKVIFDYSLLEPVALPWRVSRRYQHLKPAVVCPSDR